MLKTKTNVSKKIADVSGFGIAVLGVTLRY